MSLCVSSGLYALFSSSPSFFRTSPGTASALHLPVIRPSARGVLSLVFPLLLALCCVLTPPAVAQAGEKQVKATQHSVHKQGVETYQKKGSYPLKPTRWNVCRDMVKNLNLLQQSDASYSCELKFHPSMTQFIEPEWEELKIEDNWQLLYFLHQLV